MLVGLNNSLVSWHFICNQENKGRGEDAIIEAAGSRGGGDDYTQLQRRHPLCSAVITSSPPRIGSSGSKAPNFSLQQSKYHVTPIT